MSSRSGYSIAILQYGYFTVWLFKLSILHSPSSIHWILSLRIGEVIVLASSINSLRVGDSSQTYIDIDGFLKGGELTTKHKIQKIAITNLVSTVIRTD